LPIFLLSFNFPAVGYLSKIWAVFFNPSTWLPSTMLPSVSLGIFDGVCDGVFEKEALWKV